MQGCENEQKHEAQLLDLFPAQLEDERRRLGLLHI